jgi:dihydrofolate reductase
MKNIVYIGTSQDGFIATVDGDVDWLNNVENPEQSDFGFQDFMNSIDAVVMGRKTYEKVLSFNCPWPYSKKVFVLSSTLKDVAEGLKDKVEIVKGPILELVDELHRRGYKNLYVDGGTTIQSFLELDLIDEMIITKVPVVLKDGIPPFKNSGHESRFKLDKKIEYKGGVVKWVYTRN